MLDVLLLSPFVFWSVSFLFCFGLHCGRSMEGLWMNSAKLWRVGVKDHLQGNQAVIYHGNCKWQVSQMVVRSWTAKTGIK